MTEEKILQDELDDAMMQKEYEMALANAKKEAELLEMKRIREQRMQNAKNVSMVTTILALTFFGIVSYIFLVLNLIFRWI